MTTGLKHLITCRCVLSQFRRSSNPPSHQFVTFSIIEDNGNVRPKFVQCNNCGIVHRVTDVCRSEVVQNKEAMGSLLTIDDLKLSLPQNLTSLLETNNVDLPTWEQAIYIMQEKRWGDFIVLTTDESSGVCQGKYVRILGENMFRVETFEREEIVQ